MSDDQAPVEVQAPSDADAEWLIDELEAVVNEAAGEHDMDPMVIASGLNRFTREFEAQMALNHSLTNAPNPFGRTTIVDPDEEVTDRGDQ